MTRTILLLLAMAATLGAQVRAVHVDAAKVIGTIRSFQGVNCGPSPLLPQLPDVTRQYKDLRIDIVRTHDFFGPTDIDAKWPPDPDPISRAVRASGLNCVFPNWDADAEKEESYNFAPTDRVIRAIVESGAEVYYRVGRSWGADSTPPPDFDKFANICKHVAMHYNSGWAGGYHYNIRYWEVWNEPDLQKAWLPQFIRPFWSGTPAQFYTLYEKIARALKAYDPNLKIGTCGKAAGPFEDPYRKQLIEYCAAHRAPLDFYSWHHYHLSFDPYDMVRIGEDIRGLLDSSGFRKAESHVTEWNLSPHMTGVGPVSAVSMDNAAFTAAALIYLQDSALDRSFNYRGDATSTGFFERDGGYRKKAYSYKATGAMLDTRQRLAVSGGDTYGFAVLAGRSADGRKVQILIANYEVPPAARSGRAPARSIPRRDISYQNNRGYELTVSNHPWGKGEFSVKRYRISESENFAPSEAAGKGGEFQLTSQLPPPAVELLVLAGK